MRPSVRPSVIRAAVLPVLLGALAGAAPAGLAAQACLGLPKFTDASLHVNAAAEFPDSARSYAVGVGAGSANGLFLNLGGGLVTYQGLDEQARLGFAELGLQRGLGRLQLCPVAGGYLAAGPDLPVAQQSVTSIGASAGLAVGATIDLPLVDAIPHAAVRFEYLSQTVREEGVGSTSEHFNSGVVDVGVGIVYRRFTLEPLVRVPFAGEDDRTTVGVLGSVILPIPVPGGLFGR